MKKCKSCQKEIDQKAKKCPYCQSDQRSWFGRHPIITAIVGITVVLIVISAVSSGSKTSETSTTTVVPTTNNTKNNQQTIQPTTAVSYEKVSTQTMVSEFDKNKLAAEDTYKDKYVEFSAKVNNISEDITANPYLSLEPPSNEEYYFGTTLACYFTKDKEANLEVIKTLENGATYTLRGKVSGMTLGNIVVNECQVVK